MNNDKKQEENESPALNKGDVSKRSELLSDFEKWLNTKTYDDMWIKHIISEYRKSLNYC